MCFVSGAVYPVVGRGGRQVRPRLILKVNCKRVNMFKNILAKISKHFICHKSAPDTITVFLSDTTAVNAGSSSLIRTKSGAILVTNTTKKAIMIFTYE